MRGWESIEFKELYTSACEYINEQRVHRVEIDPGSPYTRQVACALDRLLPTHYVYDPRTGSQKWLAGLWQSFVLSVEFASRGIVPIVLLSDLSVRKWRAQAGVVTATRGVVVCFLAPRVVQPIFPHRRLVGPSLMPLSRATAEKIAASGGREGPAHAVFIGSLYEPRTTFLNNVAAELDRRGLKLAVQGRRLGSARVPDEDYWKTLADAAIIFTTASQLEVPGTDWTWVEHLIYRYIEATTCGALLVAPDVSGASRYFSAGVHFASYEGEENAVEVVAHYLTHPEERETLARRGQVRALDLVSARVFWTSIDVALGNLSLT